MVCFFFSVSLLSGKKDCILMIYHCISSNFESDKLKPSACFISQEMSPNDTVNKTHFLCLFTASTLALQLDVQK